MFNSSKRLPRLLLISIMTLFIPSAGVMAAEVALTLLPGPTVGGTQTFRASLTGIAGLTQIGSLRIFDDGTPIGGSAGIFSGFDLDAVFLDVDGNLATTGDRFFANGLVFAAGTTRPTAAPALLPNAAHPGPTFGSLNATTVDVATATLNSLDGIAVADVNAANGFLTLGDGGVLSANFAPSVPIGSTLFLFVGEVGGQPGEGLGATVIVSDTPVPEVPEPATMLLLGTGLAGVGGVLKRRRKAKAE